MAVISLENNVNLYSSELKNALLKASNYQLDEQIAYRVAEVYARNLDYSDPELMHVGVTSVANNLLTRLNENILKFDKKCTLKVYCIPNARPRKSIFGVFFYFYSILK